MDFKDKVALITGGTQGIGAAIASQLASLRSNIILVARNSDEKVLTEARSNGVEAVFLKADIGGEKACSEIIDYVEKSYGRLDLLVHCAGAAAPGGLLNVSTEDWYNAFNVHLHAVFHLCRSAVPLMKKHRSGNIILISSAAGMRGVKNALTYSVVKGAIPQFARSLAYELAESSIRVNCVSPGVIRTRFQDPLTPEQVLNNIENRIPLHREGEPEEVAAAVLALIKNNYITGHNLVIDGGLSMRIA